MNFKKILVLVMTFAMLLSAFAPTLGVFAENLNDDAGEQESNEKHYVSIGDSMTNGYGFEGYNQGNKMTIADFIAGKGVYGAGSYALQFEEYLRGKGYDVTHTKLASSALRAEDLLYLLGGRDERADDWFNEVLYYTTGAGNNNALIPELSAHYQNSVKDADIISLGIGNASFGAFFLSRSTSIIGVMGGESEINPDYTLENALAILDNEDDKQTVLDIYNKAYAKLNSYVSAEIAEQYHLEAVCDLLAYVAAGFIINYSKSIDRIVELNEKENLEVILVGLMNTTYGMEIKVNDELSIPFGDVMDEAFGLLNAYIAAYPTVQQANGNFEGVTFYYAENSQPDFIVNAFDDLAEAGWTNTDNGRLSAEIVRSRTIRTYNDTLRAMISAGFVAGINAGIEASVLEGWQENFGVVGMPEADFMQLLKDYGYYEAYQTDLAGRLLTDYYGFLPTITLADVQAYEANVPAAWNNQYFFMDATDVKNLAVAIYLGVEEAIVNSIAVEEIPLSGLETIAGDITVVFGDFAPSTASPEVVREDLANFFSSETILPLVKIYAIFNIGDGMCVHPTPTGHDDTTAAIVKSYENDWTAWKQTVKNTYDYVLEYYDEAYAFGYDYADKNGYVDKVVAVLDKVIARLELVDLADNEPMTNELKALLHTEIDALIDSLEKLREVLANDTLKDVDGLVSVLTASLDDILVHVENIYAICEQAGIDVNQLVILPALKEALVLIETELIPALKELAKEFVDAVIAHVMEKAEELYNSALGLSKEVYLQLVGLLVTVKLHVEEKVDAIVDAIVNQYLTVVEKVYTTLGNIDTAIATANKVVEYVIGRLVNVGTDVKDIAVLLNDIVTIVYEILVDAGVPVDEAIELAVEVATEVLEMYLEELGIKDACDAAKLLLEKAYELLVESGLTVEEALELAAKAFAGAVVTIVKHFDDIDNALDVTKEVLQTVYDFLVANRVEITVALKTAIEVTKTVAETVIAVVETVEDAIEYATNVFEYVLEVAGNVYETAEEIYATATELYAQLLNTIAKVHNAIETTIEIYNYVYNLLVEVFGNIENAVRVATKICQLVVEFVQNNPELLENAYKLGVEIYNLIVEVYGETDDIHATANAVYAYVLRLLAAAEVELKDAIYHASNGNYLITEESFYLALGYSFYTEELAEMLFLGDKYTQYYELTEDYREDLAKADLVTVKMENGELFSFAYDQILGTVAGIVRNSESFADYESIIAPALEEYGLSIYSEPLTLEWSKYMDEETLAIFRGALDSLTAQLVAAGVPEVYELDLTPVVMEQLPEGVAIKPIVMEIPLAELVVYAIENVLYAYAETTERIVNTLETIYEVAPNATVVITAISNPFELIGLLLEDYVPDASEYVAVADEVVELFNLPLYLAALTHKNTIYVENEDAAEIYAALPHQYLAYQHSLGYIRVGVGICW